MKLTEFCAAVNAEETRRTDERNKTSTSPFKGVFYPFPERMLAHYHSEGLTPEQTLAEIYAEHDAECQAEARCS